MVIFSLAVTLAEKSGQGPLPTWKEIYEFFGDVDVDETQAPVHEKFMSFLALWMWMKPRRPFM